MTKDQLQNAVLKYSDKALIILSWATGVGKSFAALKLMNKIKPDATLLLVAEASHKQNWEEEFIKFGTTSKKCNVIVECYASLKNYERTTWDLIICDEAHHLSEERLRILSTMQIKQTICLSATIEYDFIPSIITTLNINSKNYYYNEVKIQDAIDWGLLPQADIYLIPLVLDNTKADQIITEEWGNKKDRQEYTCNFNEATKYRYKAKYPASTLHIKCTEKQKNDYYNAMCDYYKKIFMGNYQNWAKIKWMRLGSERKRFLGDLKTKHIKKLTTKLNKENKRFICFCASIKQAEALGADHNVIHSKKKDNTDTIRRFQDKQFRSLYCIGMLTEGQNLKNVDVGIIAQLDGKERPFVQKLGRILRSESPIQYIFYFKDTRDEEFKDNIIEDIDSKFIEQLNINDL